MALNVASRLNEHVSDGPCETFISDVKVKVDENTYYYPNVMVSCDSAGSAYYRSQPVLIVEVSSPAERVDRHEKLLAYVISAAFANTFWFFRMRCVWRSIAKREMGGTRNF
ncbi:MAG: Uma2 family endonuclease [Blastocatellia bacterium]